MLKSLSTQFALTLFFGPLGLAYISVASAVFLTLLLAVLLFSEIGVLALLLVWPLSIIAGLIFVKLHNDGIRSSGSRLLLGPGEEPSLVSRVSNWARAIAVVALITTAGYLVYLYMPQTITQGNSLGRIVDVTGEGAGVSGDTTVIAANLNNNADNFAVISLPQREVTSIRVDGDGTVVSGEGEVANGEPQLVVISEVVNVRKGPGTSFPIVTQVDAGDKLFEFARDGRWINVETEETGYSGWVYDSLVQQGRQLTPNP